jgi:TRAP-type uncharacterized transport system substrate-binding protein
LALTLLSTIHLTAGGFGTNEKREPQLLKGSDGKEYQYVICTAQKDGSYYQAGKRLKNLLGKDFKTDAPLASAETTDGSRQNYELMNNGVCNVILIQEDYLAFLEGKDKSFFDNKSVVTLERTENVQLIMRKGASEDDLQSKEAKVLVGLINSGGAVSWELIRTLEKGYAKAKIVNGDIDISALSDLDRGKVDAIIRTSHLDPTHDLLAQNIDKMKGIEFVDFDDAQLNDEVNFGSGEKPIYKVVNSLIDKGIIYNTTVKTLETHVAIVIDKEKMNKEQKNKILKVITQNSNSLF